MNDEADKDEISWSFTMEPEHVPVRGNAIVSGDEAYDRQVEDEIIKRLDDGDQAAWFCLKVTGTFGECQYSEYLGCCSYESDPDLRAIAEDSGIIETVTDELRKMHNAQCCLVFPKGG